MAYWKKLLRNKSSYFAFQIFDFIYLSFKNFSIFLNRNHQIPINIVKNSHES